MAARVFTICGRTAVCSHFGAQSRKAPVVPLVEGGAHRPDGLARHARTTAVPVRGAVALGGRAAKATTGT